MLDTNSKYSSKKVRKTKVIHPVEVDFVEKLTKQSKLAMPKNKRDYMI